MQIQLFRNSSNIGSNRGSQGSSRDSTNGSKIVLVGSTDLLNRTSVGSQRDSIDLMVSNRKSIGSLGSNPESSGLILRGLSKGSSRESNGSQRGSMGNNRESNGILLRGSIGSNCHSNRGSMGSNRESIGSKHSDRFTQRMISHEEANDGIENPTSL